MYLAEMDYYFCVTSGGILTDAAIDSYLEITHEVL